MKKRIFLLLFVINLTINMSSASPASNIAVNPGFESWSNNNASDWYCLTGEVADYNETSHVYNGTYSNKLVVNSTPPSQGLIYQTEFCHTDSSYSIYYYSLRIFDNDTNIKVKVGLAWYMYMYPTRSNQSEMETTNNNTGWQHLEASLDLTDTVGGGIRIRVFIYSESGSSGGTVYIDESVLDTHSVFFEIKTPFIVLFQLILIVFLIIYVKLRASLPKNS